jgi:hypothetical protein
MNLIEEELRQIDQEVSLANETLEDLFSFQLNVSLRLFESGMPLLSDFEEMFFEKYDRYLTIHLIPELQAQLMNSTLNDESRPRVFFFVLKDLQKLYIRFVSFWEAVEKNHQKFEKIRERIREAIAYKVLPKINQSKYFQLFFEQCFTLYKETISQSFLKAQTNPKSEQLSANLSLIDGLIPIVGLPVHRDHLDIAFVYSWVDKILINDDIFQEEIFKMLSAKCETFIKNLSLPIAGTESRQTLISCFYNIFIRRFIDYLVYEISANNRPLRSTQGPNSLHPNHLASVKQQSNQVNNQIAHKNNFINDSFANSYTFKKPAPQIKHDFISTPEQPSKYDTFSANHVNYPKKRDDISQTPKTPYQQQKFVEENNNNIQNSNMPNHQLLQQSVKFKRQDICNALKLLLHKKFIRSTQEHLMMIVENFNENGTLILDLKKSLVEAGSFEELSYALQEKVIQPLISLSKSTPTILFFYINLLKFWTSLGHDFQLLQKSTAELKRYLISREDALRCIIRNWIDEIQSIEPKINGISLNATSAPIVYEKEDLSDIDNLEDSDVDFHITTGKKSSTKLKYKKSDVKTLLVDLYGSKEKFLREYENFLAEKLLYFKQINLKEETANIQLLKDHLRFGNNQTKWNVLVSDIENSQELTSLFNKDNRESDPFSFLIVSKSFWPIDYDFPCFSLEHLPISKVQQSFNEFYARNNKWRTINFHNNLGLIELDFNINGRTLYAQCQPIHAALIQIFSNVQFYEDGITLSKIKDILQSSPEFVRQKMYFWMNLNIVKEMNVDLISANPKSSNNFTEIISRNLDEFGVDPETLVYFINKDYNGAETFFVHKDEDNEMILKGQDASKGTEETEQQKIKIEGLIKAVLKSSGAKTQSKIFELLKKIYKNEVPPALTEAAFSKILQKLVKKKIINQQGEIFFAA